MKALLLSWLVVNVGAVIVCAVDKFCAKKGWHRVRESTLFIVSFLGGALGMYITMKLIRHKTLHKRFMIGLPLMILLQAAILIYVLYHMT